MNKEGVCEEPPGDFLKLRLPLSRMSKVWAVPAPRKDKLADKEALPVTSKVAKGIVFPIPTLPPSIPKTLAAWVRVTSPALKLITAPEAKNRSENPVPDWPR